MNFPLKLGVPDQLFPALQRLPWQLHARATWGVFER